MGCCLSCRSSSSFNGIRVVHLKRSVEEFNHPVTVSEITGKSSKHFVCTSDQLLSFGLKPLAPETRLQPGQLYFLLTYSIFQSDTIDLMALATRGTAISKQGDSDARPPLSSLVSNRGRTTTRSNSIVKQEPVVELYGGEMPCRARSWKPNLETIDEEIIWSM